MRSFLEIALANTSIQQAETDKSVRAITPEVEDSDGSEGDPEEGETAKYSQSPGSDAANLGYSPKMYPKQEDVSPLKHNFSTTSASRHMKNEDFDLSEKYPSLEGSNYGSKRVPTHAMRQDNCGISDRRQAPQYDQQKAANDDIVGHQAFCQYSTFTRSRSRCV